MSVEILSLYFILMFILALGPGTILYGVLITVRQRVRLARDEVLIGWSAVAVGIITIIVGFALMYFLWCMGKYLPH